MFNYREYEGNNPDKTRGLAPVLLISLIPALLICQACGYRAASSVQKLPWGLQSLAVPTFANMSDSYRLEQELTKAILSEFTSRTRVPVRSTTEGADGVLQGEIRSITSNPVTFGADTFGSAFLVSVRASVKLVRSSDGRVLWSREDFEFRERYVLNTKVSEFFSQQQPAIQRLARDFAGSLVSTLLNQ